MKPNRVAVYLTALAGVLGALAPAVANLDTTSTVGVLGGLAVILGIASRWLDGWQKFEARRAAPLHQAAVSYGQNWRAGFTGTTATVNWTTPDEDDSEEPGDPEHPLVAELPTVTPAEPDNDDLKVAESCG